jgi:hypothetical protein
MLRLTLLASVPALLLAGTATGPPMAQEPPEIDPTCMLTEELPSFLKEQFEEMPMARGVSEDGVLVTMFAATASSTWTITLTDPSGVSCILVAGTGFELTPEALARQSDAAPS